MNKKSSFFCPQFKKMTYLCTRFDAQMAESVDALVSNTNGVTPVPVRPRLWVQQTAVNLLIFSRYFFIEEQIGRKYFWEYHFAPFIDLFGCRL